MTRIRTVPTQLVDGVECRKCADCSAWVPWVAFQKVRRCPEHQEVYRKKQNEIGRARRKANNAAETKRLYELRRMLPIPEDFTAENRVSKLWPNDSRVSIDDEVKAAMAAGDVETFMRLTG